MAGKEKAVVIGAGMGGLAAAIRLSALGLAVTVVEMADAPGGKARAVPSPAGPVDTGPTVMTLPAVADDLFRLCGTRLADEVDVIPLPRLARHFWPGSGPLDLFPDPDANFDAIRAFAGLREAEGFRRFDRLSAGLLAAFDAPVMRAARPLRGPVALAAAHQPRLWPALLPGRSLESLLKSHFRDPRLVQLFGRYATYVGGRPAHSPAVLSLIWRVEAQGIFAIRQGMHGLAAALARVAAARGVEFRYATRARRIVRQGGHVTGVEVEGGGTLPCTTCIFNGDPQALAEGRLGDLPLPKGQPVKRSLSAWVWAFAAQPQGVELAHHNVFFTPDPAQEFGPIARGQMPTAPTLYVCAQDRELGTAPPPVERFEIILNGPAGHPPPEDEEDLCRTRTFPALRAQGLTFSPPPGPEALLTPQILGRRYPGSAGAIYGASPEATMAAFQRPTARTALAGLYLAGGGAHPGAGVPMALMSGGHAATAVAEDRAKAAQATAAPQTRAPGKGPISASASAPAAMHGGTSTPSRPTGQKPSR